MGMGIGMQVVALDQSGRRHQGRISGWWGWMARIDLGNGRAVTVRADSVYPLPHRKMRPVRP
jgi:hypothetical protein